jgi:hypothetical protein
VISTLIIRGRRVLVVAKRPRASAARNMARAGWPASRIRLALGLKAERLAALLDGSNGGFWGAYARVISQEMRRVG